ncbi:MAG: DUF1513 domain-containing protein [Pseudomonadota bacterium]
MRTPLLDRRAFLAAAGGSYLAGLMPAAAARLEKADAVFASAFRAPDGTFGVATLTEDGGVIDTYKLPARGHDVVWRPGTQILVAFARRPGTFAAVIDKTGAKAPLTIHCPPGRHFYGHGCFSADGRHLYATENAFEASIGVIGIYDATNGYRRIGEFGSGGVGPHDVHLLPDGKTLVVANGGIETHPDYPRAKLNIPIMDPNLAIIDTLNGDIKAIAHLSRDQHKLSIRHMAMQTDGTIWFACQNEGDIAKPLALAGSLSRDGEIKMLQLPEADWSAFRGYIGSIACTENGERIAMTSPRGDVAMVIDPVRPDTKTVHTAADVCGVVPHGQEMFLTSGTGRAGSQTHRLAFDNHVSVAAKKALRH